MVRQRGRGPLLWGQRLKAVEVVVGEISKEPVWKTREVGLEVGWVFAIANGLPEFASAVLVWLDSAGKLLETGCDGAERPPPSLDLKTKSPSLKRTSCRRPHRGVCAVAVKCVTC